MLNDWEKVIVSTDEIRKEGGMIKFRIEVKRHPGGKWFWHLKTRNGEILASSEIYSSKQKAMKMAEIINEHMVSSIITEIVK